MILTRWKIDFECRPINLCADSSGDWYRREDVDQLVERVKELEEQRAFMADANNTLRESKLEIMAENDQLKERIRLFEESDLPAEYALVTAERDRLKEEVSDMKEWITRLTAELAEARKALDKIESIGADEQDDIDGYCEVVDKICEIANSVLSKSTSSDPKPLEQ